MKGKQRIVVVEDHAVVRDGFVAIINREPDLTVCGEADSAGAALKLIEEKKPDLVIADLILAEGNGLDLLKTAKTRNPSLKFLIISMQDEEIYAERCIKAGANGYINKRSATDDFINAIHVVLSGEIYLSRKMNAILLKRFADANTSEGPSELGCLTDREIQIFQMIGAGMNTRDIAPSLGISPKTVATHRENIKVKLGLKDGRSLLKAAMNHQARPAMNS